MADVKVGVFRDLLEGALRAVRDLVTANGWDPASGSPAADEIAKQAGLLARPAPVAEAFEIAHWRLVAANEQLWALRGILDDGTYGFAVAALGRAALESSAWASWILDPAVDGRTRVARGLTATLADLETARRSAVGGADDADEVLREVTDDAEAHGFAVVRNERGAVLGVEEPAPSPSAAIRAGFGDPAVVAYAELTTVAFGGMPTALAPDVSARHSDRERAETRSPATADIAAPLATALACFLRANDRRIKLFGWDAAGWIAWRKSTHPTLRALMPRDREASDPAEATDAGGPHEHEHGDGAEPWPSDWREIQAHLVLAHGEERRVDELLRVYFDARYLKPELERLHAELHD